MIEFKKILFNLEEILKIINIADIEYLPVSQIKNYYRSAILPINLIFD